MPSRESELELTGLKPAFITLPLSNRPSRVLSASIVTPSDSSQRAGRTLGTSLGIVFKRIGAHGDASFSDMTVLYRRDLFVYCLATNHRPAFDASNGRTV